MSITRTMVDGVMVMRHDVGMYCECEECGGGWYEAAGRDTEYTDPHEAPSKEDWYEPEQEEDEDDTMRPARPCEGPHEHTVNAQFLMPDGTYLCWWHARKNLGWPAVAAWLAQHQTPPATPPDLYERIQRARDEIERVTHDVDLDGINLARLGTASTLLAQLQRDIRRTS